MIHSLSFRSPSQIMRDLRITSLPVRAKSDGDYLGFVDTLDIVTHVLSFFNREQTLEGAHQGWTDWIREDETEILQGRSVRFGITPLSKVRSSYLLQTLLRLSLTSLVSPASGDQRLQG